MTTDPHAARAAASRDAETAEALLAALPGQVAVLAPDGELLAVNAGWRAFALENGLRGDAAAPFNYFAVCAAARGEGASHARAASAGVRAVLAGSEAEFTLDYPCHAPGRQRWFRLRAVPLHWQGRPAALLIHTDISVETMAAHAALQAGAHLRAAESVVGFGTFRGAWRDGELKQVMLSRGLCDVLGLSWRSQPMEDLQEVRLAIGTLADEDDMQLALREFGAFHGGCTFRRLGELRRLQVQAHLVREEGGEVVLGVVRDVTGQEVRPATDALDPSVLRLAGASIGSWLYDRAARGFVVSREVAELLSLSDGRALRTTEALRLFAPHHRQLVMQSLRGALRDGAVFDIEAQVQRGPRKLSWVRLTGEAAPGGAGPLQGALQVVDERRNVDLALRETQRTLQLVSRCHEVLVRARDGTQLLTALCEAAVDAGDYRGAWIATGSGEGVRAAVMVQVPEALLTAGSLEWGRAAVAQAIRQRRLRYVPSITAPGGSRGGSRRDAEIGVRGLVAVPLCEGETVFGALVLYLDAERVISQRELETLAQVGRDAGFSLAALRARAERRAALAHIAEQAEILDQAHDAIIVRGMDHVVQYWNRGAEKVYGWTAAEAVGRDVRELAFGGSEAYAEAMRQLLREGSAAGEVSVRRKDGQRIWVHATWTLLRGDGERPDRVLAICTDVSLRRKIADALARSRAMLETGQALARLAGADIDRASGEVESTSGIVEILRLERPPRVVEDLAAAMEPASARAFLQRLRDPDGAFDMELEVRAPGGRRWARALGAVQESREASTVVFQDVTDMRETREEILRLNASLERRVQRRTRQLEAANRELEAFSYSVSHDLKAPLAAIDGFTLVLAERLKDKVDAREAGYLERVRAAVGRMFSLIDAMLSLHQLARPTKLRRTVVDVSALAHRIVAELRDAEPQRPCRVHIAPGLSLTGDAALIENALRNLIGNGWKFSAQKPEVELDISADPAGPDGFTTLRISDRGAGFDPAYAGKLFMPFQRLHHTEEFPGTGVGLATVQRIVHRHGGTIRAHAAPGEGATFWLSLPDRARDTGDSSRDD